MIVSRSTNFDDGNGMINGGIGQNNNIDYEVEDTLIDNSGEDNSGAGGNGGNNTSNQSNSSNLYPASGTGFTVLYHPIIFRGPDKSKDVPTEDNVLDKISTWQDAFCLGKESLILTENFRISIPYYAGGYVSDTWANSNRSYYDKTYFKVIVESNNKIYESNEDYILKNAEDIKPENQINIQGIISDYHINIGFTNGFISDIKEYDIFNSDYDPDYFKIRIIFYNKYLLEDKMNSGQVIECSVTYKKGEPLVNNPGKNAITAIYVDGQKSYFFGDKSKLDYGGKFYPAVFGERFSKTSNIDKIVYLYKEGSTETYIDNQSCKVFIADTDYPWIIIDTYNEIKSVSILEEGKNSSLSSNTHTFPNLENHTELNSIWVSNSNSSEGGTEQGDNSNIDTSILVQKIDIINKTKNRYIIKIDEKNIRSTSNLFLFSIIITLSNPSVNLYNNFDNCLINAKSNDDTKIEFINTLLKLNSSNTIPDKYKMNIMYSSSKSNTEEIKYRSGILCASYNIEDTSIMDKLSLYYGNEKIINGNDFLLFEKSNPIVEEHTGQEFKWVWDEDEGEWIKTPGEEYTYYSVRYEFKLSKEINDKQLEKFYLYTIKDNEYNSKTVFIYVFGIYESNGLAFKSHNRQINITWDENETIYSNSSNVVSSNTLVQQTVSLYDIDVNNPKIASNDKVVYIDNTKNGRTHHYTHITEMDTPSGKKYYGVRAKLKKIVEEDPEDPEKVIKSTKLIPNELYDIGIDGITYNVNAKVVLLKPRSETYNIYSFKNGTQLLTLNQAALGINAAIDYGDNSVVWSGISDGGDHEMLPSYLHSYEYLIEHKKGNDDDYNIRFTNLIANLELQQISSGEIYDSEGNVKDNIYTYATYTQTDTLKTGCAYIKINNSGNQIIESNILLPTTEDELSNQINSYQYSFSEINPEDILVEDIYKRCEEYIKISPNKLTLDLFKRAIRNYYEKNEEERVDNEIFYKYISSTKQYIPYTMEDIKNMSDLPLNIYSKSYFYNKISSDEALTNTNIIQYKKDFNLVEVIKPNEQSDKYEHVYFIDPEDETQTTYIKIRNKFESDGTQDYYGDAIVKILDDDIYSSEDLDYDKLFVKQEYTKIINPTSNLIRKYNSEKVTLYIKSEFVEYKPIPEKATIYSLDITGNTVYATEDENGNKVLLSLGEIKYIYNDKHKDGISEEEIIHSKDDSYYLKSNNIKYIVSFKGNYVIPSLSQLNNIIDAPTSQPLYIKGEDYVEIAKLSDFDQDNNIAKTKLSEYIKTLGKYNIDLYTTIRKKLSADELYAWSIDKDKEDGIYIFVNDRYISINKTTGLLSSSEGDIRYYGKDPVYERCSDLCMGRNKDYFSFTKEVKSIGAKFYPYDEFEDSARLDSRSGIITLSDVPSETADLKIERKVDKISYYTYLNTFYTYGDFIRKVGDFEGAFTTPPNSRINERYQPTVFFESKYFYDQFTINDGINVDNNGSYYTDISVFDGKNGVGYKKLFLNTHLKTATKYSYEYTNDKVYEIKQVDDYLKSVSPLKYSDYWIGWNEDGISDEIYQRLNENSDSPAYFVNELSYSLYSYIKETKEVDYNGNYEDNSSTTTYQFFDNDNKVPITIRYNDNIFGLVFGISPTENTYSNTVIFNNAENFICNEGGDKFFDLPTGRIIDDTINSDITNTDDKTTVSEELYYNDYSGDITTNAKIFTAYYIPENYEYEIVELSKFIYKDTSVNKTIYQEREHGIDEISVEKPLIISNKETIEFDGTYSWVEPEYSNVINSDGTIAEIVSKDGYWKKNYSVKQVPLTISSYNFYSKDDVSAINITYNFIPNSYILTATIDHPKISYNYLVNDTEEVIRYSYIINDKEYDYPLDGKVSYVNGTYYGVINERYYINDEGLDLEGSIVKTKVKLYRRKDINVTTNVKNIVNQDKFTSYEYFSYIQATPLTNEKIPVLYNTELVPAKSKQIQFWDPTKNSYSVKTVLQSYAYYSYKYIYETVPFKVASYLYTGEFSIGNFQDLGSYVSEIGERIGSYLLFQKDTINDFSTKLNSTFDNFINNYTTYSNTLISTVSDDINTLSKNVESLNTNTTSSIDTLKDKVTNSINSLSSDSVKSITYLNTTISTEIKDQHASIKEGFEKHSNILENRMNDLKDTIHADLMGSGEKKEEDTEEKSDTITYTIYTYTPIYERKPSLISDISDSLGSEELFPKVITGYTVSESTGERKAPSNSGGGSIAEILTNMFSSPCEQMVTTYNDDLSYTVMSVPGVKGMGDILSDLTVKPGIPNYNEFMVDLVPKLFASIDFEGDYDIVYDVDGNIKSKNKRNPTDMAKKCIMRADTLWTEMKKKGIVS